MTFTTMALLALGAAGAASTWAVTKEATTKKTPAGRVKGNTAAEREAVSASNAAITQAELGKTVGGRERPPDAPIVGRATTRTEWEQRQATPDAPPDGPKLASSNMITAYAAGERARKRAAAGGTLLTRAQTGMPGPGGSYAPKTLLGS